MVIANVLNFKGIEKYINNNYYLYIGDNYNKNEIKKYFSCYNFILLKNGDIVNNSIVLSFGYNGNIIGNNNKLFLVDFYNEVIDLDANFLYYISNKKPINIFYHFLSLKENDISINLFNFLLEKIYFNFYFSRNLESSSTKSGYIIRSDLVVGNYCDKNCVFCNEGGLEANNLNKYDLQENINLIKKEGSNWVTLGHREPTYSPFFKDNIKICKDAGVKTISVISAGYKFDDINFCEEVLNLGLNEIRFSIHGHNSELHDSITQKKGSFNIIKKGIENLSVLSNKYDFDIFIMVVICKQNQNNLLDIFKFLREFGISRIGFSFVEIRGSVLFSKFKIVPKFIDVVLSLEELFSYRDNLCVDKKESLNIENVPYCLLSYKNHKYIGYRSIKKGNEGDKLDLIDQYRDKEYISECKNCYYNLLCEGIHKGYTDIYGFDEFVKIIEVNDSISYKLAFSNNTINHDKVIDLVSISNYDDIKKLIIYLGVKGFKKIALNPLFLKNKTLLFIKNKYNLEYYNIHK